MMMKKNIEKNRLKKSLNKRQNLQRNIKVRHPTLNKGLKHATMYWLHSSYVISGYSEEYLESDILYGM